MLWVNEGYLPIQVEMLLAFLADAIEPGLVPPPLIAYGNRAVTFCRVLRSQSQGGRRERDSG
jgi:hypothetical protein